MARPGRASNDVGAAHPDSHGRLERVLAGLDENRDMRQLEHDNAVESIQADGPDRLIALTDSGTLAHVWEPFTTRLLGVSDVAAPSGPQRWRPGATSLPSGSPATGSWASPNACRSLIAMVRRSFCAPAGEETGDVASDALGRVISCGQAASIAWDSATGTEVQQSAAIRSMTRLFSATRAHALLHAAGGGVLALPLDRSKPGVHLQDDHSIWACRFAGPAASHVVTVGNPSIVNSGTRGDPDVRLWEALSSGPRSCAGSSARCSPRWQWLPMGASWCSLIRTAREVRLTQIEGSARCPALHWLKPSRDLLFDAEGGHLALYGSLARFDLPNGNDGACVAEFKARPL